MESTQDCAPLRAYPWSHVTLGVDGYLGPNMRDQRLKTIEEELLESLAEEDPDLITLIATMTEGRIEYWLRFAERARALSSPRVRAWALLAAVDAGYAAGVRGREHDALLDEAAELVRAELAGTAYEEALDVAELRRLRDANDPAVVRHADAMRARYRGYGFFAACLLHGEHALRHGDRGLALDLLATSLRAEPDILLSVRGLSDTRLDVALEAAGAIAQVEAFRAWVRALAWQGVAR